MLKAIGNKVIIKQTVIEDESNGGIILSESKKINNRGVVTAIGSGRTTGSGVVIPPCVEVGDHVIVELKNARAEVIGNDKFLIVPDEDILAVVD